MRARASQTSEKTHQIVGNPVDVAPKAPQEHDGEGDHAGVMYRAQDVHDGVVEAMHYLSRCTLTGKGRRVDTVGNVPTSFGRLHEDRGRVGDNRDEGAEL